MMRVCVAVTLLSVWVHGPVSCSNFTLVQLKLGIAALDMVLVAPFLSRRSSKGGTISFFIFFYCLRCRCYQVIC